MQKIKEVPLNKKANSCHMEFPCSLHFPSIGLFCWQTRTLWDMTKELDRLKNKNHLTQNYDTYNTYVNVYYDAAL